MIHLFSAALAQQCEVTDPQDCGQGPFQEDVTVGVVANGKEKEASSKEKEKKSSVNSKITGKNEFIFRYRVTEREEVGFEESHPQLHDYIEHVNRINVLYSEDNWKAAIQVDEVTLGLNRYKLDNQLRYSWPLTDGSLWQTYPDQLIIPEKISFYLDKGNSDFVFGDVYGSFGRGVALNVIKNTDIDIDTSLFGVKWVLSADDYELTALSGVTNQQQISRANPNLSIYRDTPHMLSSLRFIRYGLGSAQVGVHATAMTFGSEQSDEVTLGTGLKRYSTAPDASIVGADVEVFGLFGADVYLEGDFFHYYDEQLKSYMDASDDFAGKGGLIYGSVSLYPSWLILLLEGKWMRNSEIVNSFISIDNWELSTPPSLEYERMITEDSSAAVNSNDLYGMRAQLDMPIKPTVLSPYIACSVLRDLDLGGLHFNKAPELVVHPVVGLQYFPTGKILLFNAGFRRDIRDEYDGITEEEQYDQLIHVDGEFALTLPNHKGLEFNISGWKFWWGDDHHNDFLTTQNALVWRQSAHWEFIFYQDWTNNTQLQSVGNLTDSLYGAFELKYVSKNDSQLRLLYGAYKAGIRCSGGQCRTLPGFEGLQFNYSTNL